MLDFYKRMFAYDRWAGDRVIDALHGITPPPKTLMWYAHIIAAQELWLQRITNRVPASVNVYPDWSAEECKTRLADISQQWTDYLNSLSDHDLNWFKEYRDLSGNLHETRLSDILTHVTNHSTHHRAQIVSALRNAEIAPPQTDFILFARQHK